MTTPVASARRLVVKVGSSLVTNDGRGLDHAAVDRWATQIAELRRAGRQVVLVSSGAIGDLPNVAGQGIAATVVVNGQLSSVEQCGRRLPLSIRQPARLTTLSP